MILFQADCGVASCCCHQFIPTVWMSLTRSWLRWIALTSIFRDRLPAHLVGRFGLLGGVECRCWSAGVREVLRTQSHRLLDQRELVHRVRRGAGCRDARG